MTISDEAVEVAAKEAFFYEDLGGHIKGSWTWETIPEVGRADFRSLALAVLQAAAPHLGACK